MSCQIISFADLTFIGNKQTKYIDIDYINMTDRLVNYVDIPSKRIEYILEGNLDNELFQSLSAWKGVQSVQIM